MRFVAISLTTGLVVFQSDVPKNVSLIHFMNQLVLVQQRQLDEYILSVSELKDGVNITVKLLVMERDLGESIHGFMLLYDEFTSYCWNVNYPKGVFWLFESLSFQLYHTSHPNDDVMVEDVMVDLMDILRDSPVDKVDVYYHKIDGFNEFVATVKLYHNAYVVNDVTNIIDLKSINHRSILSTNPCLCNNIELNIEHTTKRYSIRDGVGVTGTIYVYDLYQKVLLLCIDGIEEIRFTPRKIDGEVILKYLDW